MAKEMDVVARLEGGMRFQVETGSGHQVRLDMAADEGGEGAGPQPMEMLLVGLAGCAGMSNLLILRKRKQDVRGYELRLHGERADLHPQVFIEITVEHIITGKGIKPEIVERAMRMTEQKYCGASVMLEKTARIRHTYRIIEADEPYSP
jgi:putative redox protein